MVEANSQRVVLYTEDDPLVLASGAELAQVEVEFETWGTLNDSASNAVFIAHALTGDAHASGTANQPGWWDTMVGPGKPVDTNHFYVICPNLLGGCRGTTGPQSINPDTGRPYGLTFPLLHIRDFVAVHRKLIHYLGIQQLFALVGGSLGGMQGLQWALDAPHEIKRSVWIAATAALTAQNIAFSAAGRAAIMSDPSFNNGNFEPGSGPQAGLALARMMAHITYLAEAGMQSRFGRQFQFGDTRQTFGVDFAVESYLNHQGETFVKRFDALSYLYLSRSLDYFEPFAQAGIGTALAADQDHQILLLSFDSDWRFGTDHSLRLGEHLTRAGIRYRHEEISAPFGHDSFLHDIPEYLTKVRDFLC
jgi:homoserine O-acetyltransferase/O-succinyltransferase